MAVLLAAVTETVSVILVHAPPDCFGRDETLDEADAYRIVYPKALNWKASCPPTRIPRSSPRRVSPS